MHFLSAPTSLGVKVDIVSCIYPCYKSCLEKVVPTTPLFAFASETYMTCTERTNRSSMMCAHRVVACETYGATGESTTAKYAFLQGVESLSPKATALLSPS